MNKEIFKEEFNTNHKLIVLSGGIDSNLILLDTVRDKINGKFDGNIYCMYMDTELILKEKIEKELNTIRTIIGKIKENYDIDVYNIKMNSFTTDIDGEDNFNYPLGCGNVRGSITNPQTMLWLGNLFLALPNFKTTSVEIKFGFNANDDLHAKAFEMLKETIESWCDLVFMGESLIKVSCPLLPYNKQRIYTRFLYEYTEFFEYLWTCEQVDKEVECGSCAPCTVKRNTLREYCLSKEKEEYDYTKELSDYKIRAVELINQIKEKNKPSDNVEELTENEELENIVKNYINNQ